MKQQVAFLLFIVFSHSVFSQHIIIGKVVSSADQTPISHASVYINSTSKITYTDGKGQFTLTDFLVPCQLVISHVSYKLRTVEISESVNNMEVKLNERDIKLDTVEIQARDEDGIRLGKGSGKYKIRNRRRENYEEFVRYFLGSDKWGKAAILKDDPQLCFWHQTDTIYRTPDKSDTILLKYHKKLGDGYGWTNDSTKIFQSATNLHANTQSNIIMELPKLGYNVSIDMNDFCVGSINKQVRMTYAYYSCFLPRIDSIDNKNRDNIEQSRKEAYYNSAQHFFRSLFSHSSYKNGYLLAFDTGMYSWILPEKRKYCQIDSLISKVSTNTYAITGLKNKRINITYYCWNNNIPVDLTKEIRKNGSIHMPLNMYNEADNSYLFFQSDTCLVRTDGIALNNDILVGGRMGIKSAGASLPSDYEPAAIIDDKKEKK